ncbi:hypothetical protein FKR81_23725 [Lentzea tibetensis]|uniref:DUF2178 domain-containing protein n=1 Tax=Lentzea tibetensis TaxID=2591470 RepID=A0A563EQH5_9PSEU|nr:hypothetical protein [Lentzea tibetensis]TWP49549.1 hypothetical protein FKR81_23725 [Lentzea tibetensis]
MAFEQKRTWIATVLAVLTYAVYLMVILGRAQNTALASVSYVAPMLWTLGAGILVTIVLSIALAIFFKDEKDQRDREIYRFGEYVGHAFVVIGAVAALGMAMAEFDHFWIANAIYLAFFLSALVGGVAKLVAYHRGFQW